MDWNEKVTFYSSPAVTLEEHLGSKEGLSDGPHKQSCAIVTPSATWARDRGRVCGFLNPHGVGLPHRPLSLCIP